MQESLQGPIGPVGPVAPRYRYIKPKPVYDRVRSKYRPHQGGREMARRVAQLAKAHDRTPGNMGIR